MGKVKRMIRACDWTPSDVIRQSIWLQLCDHIHKDDSNIYDEMVTEVFGRGR